MGSGEGDAPKTTKPASQQQDQTPTSPATIYPDWSSFQAYYNSAGTPIPPPGFFHSPVPSSPQTHPYMWGQHMMPPYGTPPPYVTMYPHGGLYGHPTIPPGSHPYAPYAMPSPNGTSEVHLKSGEAHLQVVASGGELDGQSLESKKKSTLKKSKGSLGSLSMLTGKANDLGKTSGTSANGVESQSGESGNEGSSEGSDANSQSGSQQNVHHEHQGPASAEESHNVTTACSVVAGCTRAQPAQPMINPSMALVSMPTNGVTGPTTNLNIGMDCWGVPPPPMSAIRSKVSSVTAVPAIVPNNLVGSRDVSSEMWLQDERELKRQRRKQSNRESARRSRLRKQAECEELAQRVETLKEENNSLRLELDRLREECQKLASENLSLTEKLDKLVEGSREDLQAVSRRSNE